MRTLQIHVPVPLEWGLEGGDWNRPVLLPGVPVFPGVPLHGQRGTASRGCYWSESHAHGWPSPMAVVGVEYKRSPPSCLCTTRAAGSGHVLLREPPEAALPAHHKAGHHRWQRLLPAVCRRALRCRGQSASLAPSAGAPWVTVLMLTTCSCDPGPGGVLLQVLRESPDRGDSDGCFLADRWKPAQRFHMSSKPLRRLQELTLMGSDLNTERPVTLLSDSKVKPVYFTLDHHRQQVSG